MNFGDNTLTLEVSYPEIRYEFDYEAKGRMFLLAFDSAGAGTATLKNVSYIVKFTLEEYLKDNKKYLRVVGSHLEMKPESITFYYENLFKDKALNDAFNREMSESWKEIFDKFKKYSTFLIEFDFLFSLAATFKKCNRKRDDLDQCLSTAVADAVRQLGQPQSAIGLPSLEPLEIPSLTVGAGTGPVGFAQNFHNVKIKGLTKDFTLKAKMDTKENILNLEFVYADFRIEADYEIDGRILVLPIRGKGPGLLVLERVKLNFNFFLEEYEKKNKKHYRVTKSEMAIEPGSIQFTLSNLFDGDKALGDNINQVLNDNWKEVFADVKSGYESGLGQVISSLFQNLLDKVPISDLFDDK
ncbi:unnamed protein product [Tenebrio molitor]|nr:unnamed protein product [Tenebrio molitor]